MLITLISYLRESCNLIWNTQEFEDTKEIEVNVEIIDEDEGTDIIGTYYFDIEGNFIREI